MSTVQPLMLSARREGRLKPGVVLGISQGLLLVAAGYMHVTCWIHLYIVSLAVSKL